MAVSREKLLEKLKELSPEDRNVFRDVLAEIDPAKPDDDRDPESFLSPEEVKELKDILKKRTTKKKGILETLDSLIS